MKTKMNKVMGYRIDCDYESGIYLEEVKVIDILWWYKRGYLNKGRDGKSYSRYIFQSMIMAPDSVVESFLEAHSKFNEEQDKMGALWDRYKDYQGYKSWYEN